MKSVIIASVYSFFLDFAQIFKKSGVYNVFMKIYNAFSGWWENSCIMDFLKKNRENTERKSFLHWVIYFPFAVLNSIGAAVGEFISIQVENSFILRISRGFMNNFLSLNTRFLGTMGLSAVIVRMITRHSKSPVMLAAAIMGIFLVCINYNVTDFFSSSAVIRFCQKVVGFENISWEIYKKEDIAKPHLIALAAVAGITMGVVSIKSAIFALALPVGFTGMCVILSYPIAGVFSAIIAAPFVPTMMLAGICALTFFSAAIKSITAKNFKWKIDGVGTGLGFFLVFMLASSLFSFAVSKSIMVWGMYLIFVGFYFVIINTVETKEQLYAILKLFAAFGVIVSIYGILQYIFGWNTTNAWIDEEMFESATMRVYSTMENPNVLGEYLLLLIPISAVFMLKPGPEKLEKWFYMAVFAASMICMVLTQSRGCWLGLILAAMVFVTFYNGKLWGLLPIVLVILPFIIPETMVDRMMSVGNLEDSSTSYRVFIWRGTFEMLKDFWIGGIGMGEGAFRSVYPLYSFNGIIAPHSHNTFLQLLVEGGIGALAIFVIVMAVFLKNISKVYNKNDKKSMDSMLALAIGSGVLGFLLQSMFDYTFYNYRMMAMFFIIIAFGIALKYTEEKHC